MVSGIAFWDLRETSGFMTHIDQQIKGSPCPSGYIYNTIFVPKVQESLGKMVQKPGKSQKIRESTDPLPKNGGEALYP